MKLFPNHITLTVMGILNLEPHRWNLQLGVTMKALVVNSQRGSSRCSYNKGEPTKAEPTKPCIFCMGTYFNDCCDKFLTVESRRVNYQVNSLTSTATIWQYGIVTHP